MADIGLYLPKFVPLLFNACAEKRLHACMGRLVVYDSIVVSCYRLHNAFWSCSAINIQNFGYKGSKKALVQFGPTYFDTLGPDACSVCQIESANFNLSQLCWQLPKNPHSLCLLTNDSAVGLVARMKYSHPRGTQRIRHLFFSDFANSI